MRAIQSLGADEDLPTPLDLQNNTILLAVSSVIIYMCLDDPHKRTKKSTDQVKVEKNVSAVMLDSLALVKYAFGLWSIWEIRTAFKLANSPPDIARPYEIETFSAITIPARAIHLVGFTLLISGGLFRIWAMRTLGHFFTFHLSMRDSHSLVTWGPYSWVRHPSYAAFYAIVPGLHIVMLYGHIAQSFGVGAYRPWITIGMILLAPEMFPLRFARARVKNEEEMLADGFGTVWEEYTKQTPYRLVPGFF